MGLMMNRRLRGAALTSVPAIGLGIVLYTVLRRYFQSESKPERNSCGREIGKIRGKATSESDDVTSTNDPDKSPVCSSPAMRKDCQQDGAIKRFVEAQHHEKKPPNFDVDDKRRLNNNNRDDLNFLPSSREVASTRAPHVLVGLEKPQPNDIRRKSNEIISRLSHEFLHLKEFEDISGDRRTTRWSLQSMGNSRRLSVTSRDSWMSQGSSTSEASFSAPLTKNLKDGWKMTGVNNNNDDVENNNNNNSNTYTATYTTIYGESTTQRRSSTESTCSSDNSGATLEAAVTMTTQHATRMFDFPSQLCGRLIGKLGRNVAVVKKKSGAEICVKPKVYSSEFQTVYIQGTQQQIKKAVSLIRKKFPEKKFPNVDYTRHLPDIPASSPAIVQLSLSPERVKHDVTITSVVSANHIFLHQTSHPTFASLQKLTVDMAKCYDLDPDVPALPRSPQVGLLCVVQLEGYWCRCQITGIHPDEENCEIKLVDYGGYALVHKSILRQIRTDFLSIPFQAIECYLANLAPLKNGEEFTQEMKEALEELVGVEGFKAEVVHVESDGIPYVTLEEHVADKVTSVNKTMVEQGWANWIEMM